MLDVIYSAYMLVAYTMGCFGVIALLDFTLILYGLDIQLVDIGCMCCYSSGWMACLMTGLRMLDS